jgi:MFS transporter, MHS family, proline/betaine transporter
MTVAYYLSMSSSLAAGYQLNAEDFHARDAALIPNTLAELFHVHILNSSISLGYNISLGLFGCTAPLIAIQLVSITKSYYSPAWDLTAGAIVSLMALIVIKESYQEQLL